VRSAFAVLGVVLLVACSGGAGGAASGNDVATAAARVKAGVEAQAPGLALTAQAAATTVAPQVAGAASTAQAAATAVAPQIAGAASTAQVAVATAVPQLAGAASTAQAVATSAAGSGGSPVPSQLLDQAKAQAAQALGVPPDQVVVDRVEQVQWRDSSLGCAEAGKVYAQVITPGVRVVLSGGGKRVEVHADANGQRIVTCQNPSQ
jgi:hypothetical protein